MAGKLVQNYEFKGAQRGVCAAFIVLLQKALFNNITINSKWLKNRRLILAILAGLLLYHKETRLIFHLFSSFSAECLGADGWIDPSLAADSSFRISRFLFFSPISQICV
jgi:hypothetical protein